MGWTLNELVGDSGFQNIELIDGVKEIQKDKKGWAFTKQIEQSMEELLKSIKKYKNSPTQNALEKAKQLLIRIEFWKANCMEEQTGHAAKNSDTAIWQAFYGVSKAKTDIEALLCIMDLKGFGSFADPETGIRPAKRASAVMRFIDPANWGVVDWRTIAMNRLLKKNNMNVDLAFKEARRENPKGYKENLNLVNETWVVDMVKEYRRMRNQDFPRAADIDMALFGLSLMAWPMRKE